jgi:hypothetical protein
LARAKTTKLEELRRARISKTIRARWQHYKDIGIKWPTPPCAGHNKGMPAYNRGIPHSPLVIEHIKQGMKRYWNEQHRNKKQHQEQQQQVKK